MLLSTRDVAGSVGSVAEIAATRFVAEKRSDAIPRAAFGLIDITHFITFQ